MKKHRRGHGEVDTEAPPVEETEHGVEDNGDSLDPIAMNLDTCIILSEELSS